MEREVTNPGLYGVLISLLFWSSVIQDQGVGKLGISPQAYRCPSFLCLHMVFPDPVTIQISCENL